ncbi:hypothetical protein [Aestuariimicrobium ganziense]|uniref:hypothetical protein n=1 Tax=Aestuariimicrobium ganziense TaxID=2773677 RepID=UPI001942F7B0|nr:hypothetical protein [Aestuariimicrobium ganziense]
MSTDFENDLRTSLRNTDTPDLDIDPDAVLGMGQRAVTRRNLLRGGAGLGVLAALGLGAAVIDDRLPRGAQPADGGADWVTIDFDRLPDSFGVEHADDPKTFRFEVNRAAIGRVGATQPTVKMRVSNPNGTWPELWGGSDLPDRGATWSAGDVTKGHVMGIMVGKPAYLLCPSKGANTQVSKPVPGTDLSVFLVRFNQLENGEDENLFPLYWVDSRGLVSNQEGRNPRQIEIPESSFNAFVDGQWWGISDESTLTMGAVKTSGPSVLYRKDTSGPSSGTETWAVLLPLAAADIRVQGDASIERYVQPATEHKVLLVVATTEVEPPKVIWKVDGKPEDLLLTR